MVAVCWCGGSVSWSCDGDEVRRERENNLHQWAAVEVEVIDMDAFTLLETLAIALTCVLVLVGWHAAAALRVEENELAAEAEAPVGR